MLAEAVGSGLDPRPREVSLSFLLPTFFIPILFFSPSSSSSSSCLRLITRDVSSGGIVRKIKIFKLDAEPVVQEPDNYARFSFYVSTADFFPESRLIIDRKRETVVKRRRDIPRTFVLFVPPEFAKRFATHD